MRCVGGRRSTRCSCSAPECSAEFSLLARFCFAPAQVLPPFHVMPRSVLSGAAPRPSPALPPAASPRHHHPIPGPALTSERLSSPCAGTCNAVLRQIVPRLLSVFLHNLRTDYERWAVDPAYRSVDRRCGNETWLPFTTGRCLCVRDRSSPAQGGARTAGGCQSGDIGGGERDRGRKRRGRAALATMQEERLSDAEVPFSNTVFGGGKCVAGRGACLRRRKEDEAALRLRQPATPAAGQPARRPAVSHSRANRRDSPFLGFHRSESAALTVVRGGLLQPW